MTFDYFHNPQTVGKNARSLGTEVEFGIITPCDPRLSPISSSTDIVLAYAHSLGMAADTRTRWDFSPEHPLRDARGYDLGRARPSHSVNPNAPGLANLILPNGGRFYVDHAHPEFSTPEVTDPLEVVLWDKAGERIAYNATQALASLPNSYPVVLYKNNVDGKGASYGCHENYLVQRSLDFETLAQHLIPFFVTRCIYTGAGRVGIGTASQIPGFQISQRADYIETDISLETTLNRGIINTRDEPHADEQKWRRLHVIVGDANMAEVATYLKVGLTMLVIIAIENGVDFSDLALADPVQAIKSVSRDLTLRTPLTLAGGGAMTAMDIQEQYRQRVLTYFYGDQAPTSTTVVKHSSCFSMERTADLMAWWEKVLADLRTDPLSTASYLDWTAKLSLLTQLRERYHCGWEDPRLSAFDFSYSDIRPAGIYNTLVAKGRMSRLVEESAVQHAISQPPCSTRAWLRGTLVQKFGSAIMAASWDSLSVVEPDGTIFTLHIGDPLAVGAANCAPIVDNESNPGTILHRVSQEIMEGAS